MHSVTCDLVGAGFSQTELHQCTCKYTKEECNLRDCLLSTWLRGLDIVHVTGFPAGRRLGQDWGRHLDTLSESKWYR